MGLADSSISVAIEESGPDRRSRHPESSFVQRQLAATSVLPPITLQNWTQEVIWFNLVVVTVTPLVSIWGLYTTVLTGKTFAFCVAYYLFNMIGRFSSNQ
jgi:stearoyl-CoA desaturase (Delta-9 desaturase)